MKTKSLLFALLAATAITARAKTERKPQSKSPSLANFVPGTYALVDGDANLCGDGRFYLRDNGANLALGYLHGFDTKPSSRTLPGDAPGDENCSYIGRNDIKVEKDQTTLTSTEIRTCDGVTKHNLREVAVLRKDTINLTAVQVGEHSFSYFCTWKRQGN